MPASNSVLFPEPNEPHVKTERQIGVYLRKSCPGLSISDFSDMKMDSSTYRQMTATYKALVKRYAPPREQNGQGRLAWRSYRSWDIELKMKVYRKAVKLFPELGRFSNNWLGKRLATNVINNKNSNEAAAAMVKSAARQAVETTISRRTYNSI